MKLSRERAEAVRLSFCILKRWDNMAGVSKYNDYIQGRLHEIEYLVAAGSPENEVAKFLGISAKTFIKYKKEHKELNDAIKRGLRKAIPEVRNALFRSAVGYTYTEKKTYKKKTPQGDVVDYIEITEKVAHPNPTSIAMYLRNHDPDWIDKDKLSNDMKQREIELRERLAEARLEEW